MKYAAAVPSATTSARPARMCVERVARDRGDEVEEVVPARRLRGEDLLPQLLAVAQRVDAHEIRALVEERVRVQKPTGEERPGNHEEPDDCALGKGGRTGRECVPRPRC